MFKVSVKRGPGHRKEVNKRDLILKKYTGDTCPYPTYIVLESDTLASYYDNPVFKRYSQYLKKFI